MRVRTISLLGVRGLDGLKLDLPRAKDTDLVVVYGRQASGKTTFLDALAAAKEAVAAYGSPDGRWDSLVGSLGAAKVHIGWEASADEQTRMALADALLSSESILGKPGPSEHPVALTGLLTEPGTADRGSIHYLHDTRELDGPLSFGSEDAGLRNRLTTRNSKFAELYDVLDQPERRPQLGLAAARFAELFPRLEILGLRRMGTSFYPMVRDRDTNEARTYETLSTSERQGFLLALYTARQPIVDSIVLLDAPERGFGDGAVELVRALLRWTSKTQLIVATGAAAVRAMPEVSHQTELPSS